jgi:FkbM family methyltransferase
MANHSSDLLGQETEIQLLTAWLPHIRKTFVDVGAEQGSFGKFLIDQGFRGALFEPLPKHQEALAELTRTAGVVHHKFAVDQQDGKAEFHIACDESGKPLDFFHSLQPLKDDPRVHHKQTLPVVCRSLASLHTEGVIEDKLGVLKIDTEGNDLRVLRGLGTVRAEVVICEFFTKGIYNGWEEAEPLGLINQAAALGYTNWVAVRRRGNAEMLSLNTRCFTEKEWGNLIFLTQPVFNAGLDAMGRSLARADEKLFSQIENIPAAKRRRWLRW